MSYNPSTFLFSTKYYEWITIFTLNIFQNNITQNFHGQNDENVVFPFNPTWTEHMPATLD